MNRRPHCSLGHRGAGQAAPPDRLPWAQPRPHHPPPPPAAGSLGLGADSAWGSDLCSPSLLPKGASLPCARSMPPACLLVQLQPRQGAVTSPGLQPGGHPGSPSPQHAP